MTTNPFKDLNEFVEKIDSMKKQDKMDLSSDQDLSIAIMNLISIEEHFFFTGAKTGKDEYYDLINEVRSMRKDLLKRIIKEYEGEVWCISKHLLAASMRLMEVGTKQLGAGKKEEAYDLFEKAFNLYSLFWGMALKIIDTKGIKKIQDDELFAEKNKENDTVLSENNENPQGITKKLGALVKKIIDCCIE